MNQFPFLGSFEWFGDIPSKFWSAMEGMAPPFGIPRGIIWTRTFKTCTHAGFYMRQVPLAHMLMLRHKCWIGFHIHILNSYFSRCYSTVYYSDEKKWWDNRQRKLSYKILSPDVAMIEVFALETKTWIIIWYILVYSFTIW